MNNLIPIIFGEPKSINCEIIAKTWRKLDSKSKKRIFLIGNHNIILHQLKREKIRIRTLKISKFKDLAKYKKNFNIIKVLDIPFKKLFIRTLPMTMLSCFFIFLLLLIMIYSTMLNESHIIIALFDHTMRHTIARITSGIYVSSNHVLCMLF